MVMRVSDALSDVEGGKVLIRTPLLLIGGGGSPRDVYGQVFHLTVLHMDASDADIPGPHYQIFGEAPLDCETPLPGVRSLGVGVVQGAAAKWRRYCHVRGRRGQRYALLAVVRGSVPRGDEAGRIHNRKCGAGQRRHASSTRLQGLTASDNAKVASDAAANGPLAAAGGVERKTESGRPLIIPAEIVLAARRARISAVENSYGRINKSLRFLAGVVPCQTGGVHAFRSNAGLPAKAQIQSQPPAYPNIVLRVEADHLPGYFRDDGEVFCGV